MLELPRSVSQHDSGADRKLRPARRREAALPPLFECRKPRGAGFYGAEAAAEQGYGWQYTYLFFRNQDEAERVGIDQDFLDSIAGGVEELNGPEWEDAMEKATESGSEISTRLERYEEIGRDLEIRTGQAMIISGARGTKTLQDSPKLGEVERAISEVE